VILEPVLQGAGGMRLYPAQFLRDARALTTAKGIPLIADEVLTGFGRTGAMFACEHGPIAPDIMCLSKALTAGYLPFGATLCSEAIYQAFLSDDRGRTLLHGHSYTGNALACAVGLESLRIFDEERRLDRVRAMESLMRGRLEDFRGRSSVAEVRSIGGMAAIELAARSGGYFDEIGPHLYREALARDVLLRPLGNVLYVLPPYAITDTDLHRVFDVIREIIG
jgi:adenosylmethionine-8-amino-7-oxononanoate aminotransferase